VQNIVQSTTRTVALHSLDDVGEFLRSPRQHGTEGVAETDRRVLQKRKV
jgi:hypothetical protein